MANNPTFNELYEAVKIIDSAAPLTRPFHYPLENDDRGMQIYSNLSQVNIGRNEPTFGMFMSAIDILFSRIEENEVGVVQVDRKGYADYDHITWVPSSTSVDDVYMIPGWVKEFIMELCINTKVIPQVHGQVLASLEGQL